jgi:nucleotide-binding universal stress UspA family protein
VRCLFATDHSPYADFALEQFLSHSPKGIDHLTVFTAIEPTCRMEVANLHRHLADGRNHMYDARMIATKCDSVACRLMGMGISASTRLRTGHVVHLIEEAMVETGAELVIVGAQGQGAAEGKGIGSTASSLVHSSMGGGCWIALRGD